MRVGIIGHGTLGGAIAQGLRASAAVTSIESTTRRTSARNGEMVRASDVVLLCVKPPDVEPVLDSISQELTTEHVLISTAASVGIESLRLWARQRGRIVRAMPNTPAQAGAAMTVVARDAGSCDSAIETARILFSSLGRTIVMHADGCGHGYQRLRSRICLRCNRSDDRCGNFPWSPVRRRPRDGRADGARVSAACLVGSFASGRAANRRCDAGRPDDSRID